MKSALHPVRSLLCTLLGASLLAGCTLPHQASSNSANSITPTPIPTAGVTGRAMGGQQPITGATVQLYAANSTTSQGASTALLTSSVTTGAGGLFNITGLYNNCSVTGGTSQVYLLITGGNPGLSSSNANIALMAAIGNCNSLTSGTFINVNEVTTVAAMAALYPYYKALAQIGASSLSTLTSAFTLANELANYSTGSSPGTNVPTGYSVPTSQINLMGNILASCINSTGGVAGDGSACGNLFTDATTGSTPTNTIKTLSNLYNAPSTNLLALFGLAPSLGAPFSPALSSPPPNWSVALYTNALVSTPTSLTFAATNVGLTSAAQTITLQNTGSSTITSLSASLTGTSPGDYAIASNNCSTSLAAYTACSLTVTFTPTATGLRYANLSIANSSSNVYVPLTGTGQSSSSLAITTASLTSPTYGQSYSATLAATGGTGSGRTWSITSGQSSLTAINLSLSSAGVLSGTPAAIGTATFTVQVTDSGSNTATATYTIGVSNPQSTPSGTVTAASVTVTSQSAGSLPSSFSGFSYGKTIVNSTPYALNTADTSLINLFKLLTPSGGSSNPPVLRIGGSQVDGMTWSATGTGGDSNYVEKPDVDSLAGFMAATGWQTIYAINLGSSSPNCPSASLTGCSPVALQTTALAQAEISYVASDFSTAGASAPMIEIGNECDNYNHSGHAYNGVTGWTTSSAALSSFETLWATYRAAVVSAVPTAVITGPASGNNETSWTEPFAQAESGKFSLMTQHYYRFSGGTNPTPANLISYPDNLSTSCTTSSGCPASNALTNNTANTGDGVVGDSNAATYIGSPGSCSNDTGLTCTATNIGVPWRMSETNSLNSAGSSGPLGTSNGYGSALWVLDHMFTLAYGGASGVNISGISNNSTGYQPISFSSTNNTPNTSVQSVNPSYYGMLLFSQMGFGTLYNTLVSAGSLNVSAYTVQTASGAQNLMVVNKDATNNLNLTINLATPVSYAKLMLMTQLTSGNTTPDLTAATGVTIQGSSVSTAGAYSPGTLNTCTVTSGIIVNCYVPVDSAVVIQMQ